MYVNAQFNGLKMAMMARHPAGYSRRALLTEPTMTAYKKVFLSYWQAGYEGADHISHTGRPLCMNDATRHTDQAYDDYLLLKEFGISTVRESVGWRSVEKEWTLRLFIRRAARGGGPEARVTGDLDALPLWLA